MHRLILKHILKTLICSTIICISIQATAQSNKVKSVRKNSWGAIEIAHEVGSPLEITYEDNRVAQVVRREKLDTFKVPLYLTENSCKPTVGIKCHLVVPFIREQFAAIWKVHPTRKGQPVEYANTPNVTFGSQNFITRHYSEVYDMIATRMQSRPETAAQASAALNYKNLAYIECAEDVSTFVPAVKEILFFDEIYEQGNSELARAKGMDATPLSVHWRRYQSLPIKPQGNTLHLGRYKQVYGVYTDQRPFGLSYHIKMWFRSPNIIDKGDELCELFWKTDFNSYFPQILSVISNGGFQAFSPTGYVPYIFSRENISMYSTRILEVDLWEHAGVQ